MSTSVAYEQASLFAVSRNSDARKRGVTIYTDGSCYPNPGPGGWGAVLIDQGGRQRELYGGELRTTNQRVEVQAAVEAMRALKVPCSVDLYSDSMYLVNVGRFGIERRLRSGANVDLWEALASLLRVHDVRFFWVKGHAGDPLNERADRLAALGAQGYVGPRPAPRRPTIGLRHPVGA